jgi:Periplasmic binding protein
MKSTSIENLASRSDCPNGIEEKLARKRIDDGPGIRKGSMSPGVSRGRPSRLNLLKGSLGAGILQVASPFVLGSRAAESVKIGLADPITGPYAGLGKSELIGCEFAVEQINAKGGILGREVELVVEDSSSGDAGTAVQKTRKLIDSDKVAFLIGNVNSALSLAMAHVAKTLSQSATAEPARRTPLSGSVSRPARKGYRSGSMPPRPLFMNCWRLTMRSGCFVCSGRSPGTSS